jgi:hypothetical protein
MISKPKFKNNDDEDKVKEELKKVFWDIRDVFKYYSSISSSTGSCCFGLQLNSFTELMKAAGIYRNKTITLSDTDTIFLTLNKREKKSVLNPGNALIRYQFLE